MPTTEAKLHDGATIEVDITGSGPSVLMPVNPHPVEGPQAEQMRLWGVDPALGRNLIDGLADRFRVVAFDYEGHVIADPKPGTLTPDKIAEDMLAVADAADADTFGYYGYSWLALSGLQLAIRTDRLSALAMGGFPPIDGPYREMLAVTEQTHRMSVERSGMDASRAEPPQPAWNEDGTFDWDSAEVTMTEPQTRQFVTLYRALRGFDDSAAQNSIACPRLCFAGSADTIEYGERWGGVTVDICGPLMSRRADLESLGWQVEILDGLDHVQAMQAAAVLPVLRPWLRATLGT